MINARTVAGVYTQSQYGNILDLGGHETNKTAPPYTIWASEVDDGTSRCNIK